MKNRFIISILCLLFMESLMANQQGHRAHLAVGPHLDSFNLSSDAFSAEQPFATGQGFILGYAYFNGEGLQNEIQVSESNVIHKTAATLAPSEVTLRQQQVQWKMLNTFVTYDDVKFLKFGLGYTGHFKNSEQTTPHVLFTNTEMHSINLLGVVDLYKRNDFTFNFEFDLGFPFRFKEYGAQSGTNVSTYYYKVNLNAVYQMNSYWSIDLSAQYEQFVLTADGLGSRGTQNAREIQSTLFFPIGVSYDF